MSATFRYRATTTQVRTTQARIRFVSMSAVSLMVALFLASPSAFALRQGSTNIGVGVTSGRALDQTYTVISARLGYFVADLFRGDLGVSPDTGDFGSMIR